MTAMQALPKDSPIMIAWENYKSSDEYANSRKWAASEKYVDGSMWAAFLAGYQASAPSQPAPVAGSELPDALAKLKIDILRAVFDWQAPFEIAKALYSTPTKGQCEAIVTTLGAMRDDYLVHYAAQNNTYKITERGRDYFNSRLATVPSQPAPVVDANNTPANVDRMDERGFVTWASTEEGGGPDVGITVGLGHDLGHLWLGEITRDRWEDVGGKDFSDNDMGHWLIHYAPGKEPDVLAKASQPDHDPLREFLEDVIAPLLRASPQPDRESERSLERIGSFLGIAVYANPRLPPDTIELFNADGNTLARVRSAVAIEASSNRPQATEGEK